MNRGVLAFGDSITNGGGELQWGVALQSWALWVARGLGLPFSGYAADGATARDVVTEQIPRFERVAVHQSGYDLGCLYIGVNDVRRKGLAPFSHAEFERDVRAAVAWLGERCERTLVLTIPLDLGRPPAGEKVQEANAIIEAVGADFVCDLREFRARNHVMADRVHPTAFGQIAIAERALRCLDLPVRVWPSTLVSYETTAWKRLRGDLTYAYRYAKNFTTWSR